MREPRVKSLKAFVLYLAIKNLRDYTVLRRLQRGLPAVELESDTSASYSLSREFAQKKSCEAILQEHGDNPHELSLISWALRCGYHSLAMVLLDETPSFDCNGRVFDLNEPPLVLASMSGNERLARSLIMKGADIQARGHSSTPLVCASLGGYENVVRLLIDKGVDVDVAPGGLTALHGAASCGHQGIIQLLLAQGAAVDAQDFNGSTALSKAVRGGHEMAALLILDAGANPALSDSTGIDTTHLVLEKACNQPGSLSDTTVSAILRTAYTFRSARSVAFPPPRKLRRAEVNYEATHRSTGQTFLWLDSYHALIETLHSISNVTTCKSKVISYMHPSRHGKDGDVSTIAIRFSVIHGEETLNFTIGQKLGPKPPMKLDSVRLTVKNGGERFSPLVGYGCEKWTNVELDPHAEILSSVSETEFQAELQPLQRTTLPLRPAQTDMTAQ